MLITVEGISGSGKTTLINNLKPALEKCNPIYTSEPYGNMKPYIKRMVGGIKKQGLYYLLSHAEHLERLIDPKVENNIIISERFFDNIIAQQENIQQLDIMKLIEYQKKVSMIPDLTILLICDPEVAYGRNKEELVYDSVEYLKSVQDNYLLLAKMRDNVFVYDTTDKDPQNIIWHCQLAIGSAIIHHNQF